MKRTGVIVGVDRTATTEEVKNYVELLHEVFPGVQFAVVSGAQSVSFEYDPLANVAMVVTGPK